MTQLRKPLIALAAALVALVAALVLNSRAGDPHGASEIARYGTGAAAEAFAG